MPMKCERCQGLMIRTQHLGMSVLRRKICIWKCLNCGNILDHTILLNRLHEWETGGRPISGRDSLPRFHCLNKRSVGKRAA